MSFIIKIISFLIFPVNILLSQTPTANFLIARNPVELEILNQYQQKLTSSQKQSLLKYTPWQIIEPNILLSDNYTKAMRVKFDSQYYYFVRDEDENLITSSIAPQIETYKNCSLYDQFSEIIMDKAVLFREIPFSLNREGFPKEYLEKGTVFRMLFKKGSSYFVNVQSQNRFGWVRINNRAAINYNNEKKKNSNSGFSEILLTQLDEKIFQINSLYLRLYKYLNTKYAQQKTVPYWEIISLQNEIRLSLKNENHDKIKKSMTYLINDLENMIIGQALEINSSQEQIVLKLKNDK